MLSQKGPACSASEQSAYLVSWFHEYSDLQRDDFLRVLARKYATASPSTEGLEEVLSALAIHPGAPPSLFQCRMSLFDQWFQGWSDEDKAGFLDRLRSVDAEFVDRISSVPNGRAEDYSPSVEAPPAAATTVLVNHCTSVTVNGDGLSVDDEVEDEVEEEEVEDEVGNREVVSPTEEPQVAPRTVLVPSPGVNFAEEEQRASPLGEKIEFEEDGAELVL
ncbi:uncharacterized protein LOC144164342 [Haemaphysalis longicornis]